MKNYKFPSINGGATTKTLAPSKNYRIVGMLSLLGLKSYSEMFSPEKMIGGLVAKLDLAIDQKKMKEALKLCLVEGIDDIDLDNVDTVLFDEVVQDFFEQRAKSMTERLKSSVGQ
jgi:hypothetical protein